MNKQLQTALGVVLLLGAGIYLYQQQQKKKTQAFAN